MRLLTKISGLWAAATATVFAGAAIAQDSLRGLETIGKPQPGGTGFQLAVTETARELQWLDGFINVIIIAIVVLVCLLLAYIAVRYNSKTNPKPATFTHNSPLEVAWTIVPVVILVFIGAFSLPILFKQQEIPEGDIHIKVTGNQWYWSYEYVDSQFGFDSFLLPREELAANGYADDEYLLATDTALVLPVNKTVIVTTTGSDVIHGWFMPAFGVQLSAVPGRLSELWFRPEKEGVYFGQCSALCGKDHAYMPITVKVVSQEAYDAWLQGAIAEYAGTPAPLTVASNN
ncbi:cytochrome c oxidase subunit II [Pseudogemmobacter sp. W21_MBD1_M6]|uniref:cytochrome c oxidase subunit II n=1 Tax=Pseudogemmobacter sp. W21_MBD1_M6 TaxID=3240271 RepID=UPI003F954C57